MAKQIKIKTTPVKVDVATPSSILNIEELQSQIMGAKTSKDLIDPATTLSLLIQQFTEVDKAFKAAVKQESDKAKIIKDKIAEMEAELKARALKNVKVIEKQKINQDTGEVKRTREHDLNTKIFSYTPGSQSLVIDTKTILDNPEEYKQFLKPVITYQVDFDAINKAAPDDIPWVEQINDPKISLSKKITPELKKELMKEVK